MSETQGSLICVGTGINHAGQISIISESHIKGADIVFCGVAESLTEQWIGSLNPNMVSLQQFYADGKFRPDTYREMRDAIMDAVRAGKRVCAAFYGHPGIFASIAHMSIAMARAEGFRAAMEPGISAEACLYADLGLDPADHGCQSFEANQLMFYKRQVDTSALLLVWQIALAGEHTSTRFSTTPEALGHFVDTMVGYGYPRDHEVILYEAASLAVLPHRAETVTLEALPDARLNGITTLVVPPATAPVENSAMRALLAAKDHQDA